MNLTVAPSGASSRLLWSAPKGRDHRGTHRADRRDSEADGQFALPQIAIWPELKTLPRPTKPAHNGGMKQDPDDGSFADTPTCPRCLLRFELVERWGAVVWRCAECGLVRI
ncbi:hypothetical protein GCM10008097_17350 [Mycetocola manganoxydans]|nr:hypothetical protein GCM10008097_17350 [Mycetocola manganoxydans]